MITYTAKGRYYKVYRNGSYVSQHTTEREASEASVNLVLDFPESHIKYVHEYEVVVEVDGTPPHDTPEQAAATVTGLADPYGLTGPSAADDPSGVFFGRTDLADGDIWWIVSVSSPSISVTPMAGGSYRVAVAAGTPSGTHSFDWMKTGSAPTTGTKEIMVT